MPARRYRGCDLPERRAVVKVCQSRANYRHHSFVVVASLIGFAFSDDIKSCNGHANSARRPCTPLNAAAAALLPKHSRSRSPPYVVVVVGGGGGGAAAWHAPCRRPASACMHRPRSSLPLLSFLCAVRRAVIRDLEPHPGKNQRIISIFCSPSVQIGCSMREQSRPSAILRVISESYYILGGSLGPGSACATGTRTMILPRRSQSSTVRQSVGGVGMTKTNAATNDIHSCGCY